MPAYEAGFEPAMRLALAEAAAVAGLNPAAAELAAAELAAGAGAVGEVDVPVGAVVLDPAGATVAAAGNRREAAGDPTAHAEIEAIRQAARVVGTRRLDGYTIVVTLEPCTMCAGAIVLARLSRLVYGAVDAKAGAAGSLWDVLRDRRLSHQPEVIGGVLEQDCGALLTAFFAARRGTER